MVADLETERLLMKCIGYEDTDFFFREFSDAGIKRCLYDAPGSGTRPI